MTTFLYITTLMTTFLYITTLMTTFLYITTLMTTFLCITTLMTTFLYITTLITTFLCTGLRLVLPQASQNDERVNDVFLKWVELMKASGGVEMSVSVKEGSSITYHDGFTILPIIAASRVGSDINAGSGKANIGEPLERGRQRANQKVTATLRETERD